MSTSKSKNILLVDNEVVYLMPYVGALEDCGYRVAIARNPKECMSVLEKEHFDAVIVDIMLPHGDEFSTEVTQGGSQTGLALARLITKKFPKILVVGLSVRAARDVSDWFENKAAGFWSKSEVLEISSFTKRVDKLFQSPGSPRIFIVHGHDDATKYELKNYIQNTLGLGEPLILHEQPSLGRTIIEKFEDGARDVDLVFVLLTPDDVVFDLLTPETLKRRARQNVIFELGFFFGKLQRKAGKVLLLYKGSLDLPSDISGVVYIDISGGIAQAGEEIRRETRHLFFMR